MTIAHIGLFVLGLVIGSNLSVGLMCILRANSPDNCDQGAMISRLQCAVEYMASCWEVEA